MKYPSFESPEFYLSKSYLGICCLCGRYVSLIRHSCTRSLAKEHIWLQLTIQIVIFWYCLCVIYRSQSIQIWIFRIHPFCAITPFMRDTAFLMINSNSFSIHFWMLLIKFYLIRYVFVFYKIDLLKSTYQNYRF